MQHLEQQEFENLFRTEFAGLCFFAQKYVKDLEAAREIVQESFIQLWEKRDTLDTSRNIKSYLATSIRNKCLNYLRDNKKFNAHILQLENLLELTVEPEHDVLVEKELHNAIQLALDELPEKCREVFVLNRYDNLRYKEIADKLGISVKTVEAQMSKALQHLRIKLAVYLTVLLLIITMIK